MHTASEDLQDHDPSRLQVRSRRRRGDAATSGWARVAGTVTVPLGKWSGHRVACLVTDGGMMPDAGRRPPGGTEMIIMILQDVQRILGPVHSPAASPGPARLAFGSGRRHPARAVPFMMERPWTGPAWQPEPRTGTEGRNLQSEPEAPGAPGRRGPPPCQVC